MRLLKSKPIFLALLALYGLGYFLRLTGQGATDIIHQHVSNFAITGGLFCIMGSDYIFKKGFTFKSLLLLAAPLALLNIILELFIKSSKFTFLGVTFINFNTPDPLDLLFGLLALAVAIPVIYLNSEKYTIK